jgi:hypothetical protein
MTKQLQIRLTDEFDSFTEQLDTITQAINRGETNGTGWHIETEGDSIDSGWCIEDIRVMEEDHEVPEKERMTDEECREVLRLADRHHDASIGINWDVLQIWYDEVKDNRE